MNTIEQISYDFFQFLMQRFNLSEHQAAACKLVLNVDESKQQFGDLNSNAAMILAKELKKSPQEIATAIAATFKHPAIERIELAGPGFLNLFLIPEAFKTIACQLYEFQQQFFTLGDGTSRYRYNIEFVSANPTGPLHLGHGRGGIIGDVLGNILRFLGHHVTKEFYINDAGSQLQKLGQSFKVRVEQALGKSATIPEDGYHGDYLIELADACIAQHGPQVLEKNDDFFVTYAKEHLLEQQQKTLADYGINFDMWFSEKELHTSGAIEQTLTYLQEHNQTYEGEGALWFKSQEYGDDKDRVLRKSTGELTYVSADAAYLKDKVNRGFNHLIMILGQDHHSYVVRLHGLQKALGIDQIPLDIILYQLVSLKENGEQFRMSKRAGRMVTLQEIIDLVGTDVARFFYLNRKADAHLDFDLDLALKKTDENPVYYLQYAYVRMLSILEKAATLEQLQYVSADDVAHLSEADFFLIKKIVSLKELLISISTNHQSHLLTYYALELAHSFHRFYAQERVIDTTNIPRSRSRLLLIMLLKNTFDVIFELLGISKKEKM